MLNVFGDTEMATVPNDEELRAMKSLVRQAYLIYGGPPFGRYDFLLAVSDRLSSIGREHRRSSEDTAGANFFTAWDGSVERKELLPHEFNHAWIGKGRRPLGQDVDDLNTSLDNELLWVYEGQTKLWGYILATRSGMWSMDESRDMMAQVAAGFDRGNPGLTTWRSALDTTNDPIIALTGSPASTSYQGSYEYYLAGAMIWLDVDGELRRPTGNRRTLDDFSKEFFGKGQGGRKDAPYSFADVVRQLDDLAPYDWSTFLHQRLSGGARLNGGLASHGWKLVYTDQPSDIVRQTEAVRGVTGLMFSLGLSVDSKGNILEILWDGPAFKAELVEGQTITEVDGKPFSASRLRNAIVAAHDTPNVPVELIVKDADGSRPVRVDYRGGLQYDPPPDNWLIVK
jgi:predicted metalloprotease with PDZ domain